VIELARAHSNLATVGIVAQPSTDAIRYAERALGLCDELDRDDLRAQALCYLGTGRLAQGDPRGSEDLEHAIAIGATETRLETRVRTYVNAAGGAYRAGRPHDARRYVTAGLRLAADGEFAAGQYRLHLTSAALSASSGDWDRAIAELRALVTSPGTPAMMALLARSLLARLLARRGDPESSRVLEEALNNPRAGADSYVAGPLAVAQVEAGWLNGTLVDVPAEVRKAMELAADAKHTAILGELGVYLRRAGHEVTVTTIVPMPWAPALDRRWRQAAAAWKQLGEQYEQAVELTWSGNSEARADGLAMLTNLGATATVSRALTTAST
jgi:hypothetical protein